MSQTQYFKRSDPPPIKEVILKTRQTSDDDFAQLVIEDKQVRILVAALLISALVLIVGVVL